MKQIYYLVNLPRAGNTALASVLNQNKNMTMTAKSILAPVVGAINDIYFSDKGQSFPDEKSYLNLIEGVFSSYYKDWESQVIIDRGAWGQPDLLNCLNKITKPKFIILHRPLLECLASFIKLVKPVDDRGNCIKDIYCDFLMNKDEIMGLNLLSIKNILNSNYDYYIIKYDDFVKNPQSEINKLCKFVNVKPHKINFKKIKQLKINNTTYNDDPLGYPFHKIKENIIEKTSHNIEKILNKSIIEKYLKEDIKL
jgi:hypothetical protein